MRKIYKIGAGFMLLALSAAACAPTPVSPITNTPGRPAESGTTSPTLTDDTLPAGVKAVRQALAEKLGIAPSEVTLDEYQAVEWPDACLGAPGQGEQCAEVITPGYGGMALVGEEQWEFHTDESGSAVRLIPGAALSARQILAQQQHLELNQVEIIRAERTEWPDSCLGVEIEGLACTEAITPGYIIQLSGNGQSYEFHTDLTGGNVILASAPEATPVEPALVWESISQPCTTAQVTADAVAFGPCGGALMEGKFAFDDRAADLAGFVADYASFEAQTPAGKVRFNGQGQRAAAPAEERMLAEWAALVYQEAVSGRSGASWGLALAWHREGGIAGFCDDLTIYYTGEVMASSCKGDPVDLGRSRLPADQLEQLYHWMDTFKPFEVEQKDPAVADAMTIRMVFSGRGTHSATEADQQKIQEFAAQLYARVEQANAAAQPEA